MYPIDPAKCGSHFAQSLGPTLETTHCVIPIAGMLDSVQLIWARFDSQGITIPVFVS